MAANSWFWKAKGHGQGEVLIRGLLLSAEFAAELACVEGKVLMPSTMVLFNCDQLVESLLTKRADEAWQLMNR
jgi:hypothetical protein